MGFYVDLFHPGDEGGEKKQDMGRLPAAKWAVVYGRLRPFLRPFGESGEGRLDFYHRSLSKAVRMRQVKSPYIILYLCDLC